jgi:hypothetical protein
VTVAVNIEKVKEKGSKRILKMRINKCGLRVDVTVNLPITGSGVGTV